MKLRRLQVENFRSLKSLDVDLPENGMLVLVGANNAGKSNIIRSIDAVCGDTWFSNEKLEDHDYYQRDKDRTINIKLTFDDGRVGEFSSDEKWARYYDSRGTKIRTKVKDDFPCVYLGADRTFDRHMAFYDWTLVGRIRRAFHQRAQPLKDALEAKFGEIVKVFDQVDGFASFKGDFAAYFTELQADTGTRLRIDFQPYTPSNYFKTLQIVAEDPLTGQRLDLAELGEGSRNIALLALLRSYAKNLRAVGQEFNGILALEEPEIYMHPQAQRHLRSVLREIASAGMQVILSTHSACFVDTEDFESIGRVFQIPDEAQPGWRKTELVTVSRSDLVARCHATGAPMRRVNTDNIGPFYRTTSNTQLNEGFFSRVLILVEGDTEELSLPVFLEHVGFRCDLLGISPIGVHGKNQIPKYWRLFGSFRIPIIAVFDNDDDFEGSKRESNVNLASCFGLDIEELLDVREGCRVLRSRTNPITPLIVINGDFETSLRNDFTVWNSGDAAPYDALELEARKLIKPLRGQNKGQLARYVARGLRDRHPDYQPTLIGLITGELAKLGVNGSS